MTHQKTSSITLIDQCVTFWWLLGNCPVTTECPEHIRDRHLATYELIDRDHKSVPSFLRTVFEGGERYDLENFEVCEFYFEPVDVDGQWAHGTSFSTKSPDGFSATALHELRALCEAAYECVAQDSGLTHSLGLVTRYNTHKVTADEAIPFPMKPSVTASCVYVHARATRPEDELDDEDSGVVGVYEVALHEAVPPEGRANAALDGFHSSVPVANLDDFEFIVREGPGAEASVIEEADDIDSMTLGTFVTGVERMQS